MELSTITGIVIAIIIMVIALKMIFSKSADPMPQDENLNVHAETNLPVVPRHIRADVPNAKTSHEKVEPTLGDVELDTAATTKEPEPLVENLAQAQATEPKPVVETRTETVVPAAVAEDSTTVPSEEKGPTIQALEEQVDPVVPVQAETKAAEKKPQVELAMTSSAVSTASIEEWDGESNILDLHLTEQERHDEASALACAEHIVALYVWPSLSRALSGEKALKLLLKYGLRFGEMQCFHRYQQLEESSPLMFSVLRLTDEGPAGFDLETLSTEQVKGLAFFLALPNAHAGLGFDSMASIANHIAKEIEGTVYDENSQELTPQLREHWRHQVLEFKSAQTQAVLG